VRVAQQLGIPVSGDINYRRVLWQYGKAAKDVMPELVKHTDFVIAGVTDFENCLGITGKDFEEACRNVTEAYPNIKRIATTFRDTVSSSHNKIYGVLWSDKALHQSKEYDLTHIVDRVGAGDAFMAGLIYGVLNGKEDAYTVEFATAASALKHSIEGDVNVASLSEVETLLEGKNIGKLLR
jgi:2-dehydro-3-deoxygluconokinase